jgi:rhodanese-related sulfurtransferase
VTRFGFQDVSNMEGGIDAWSCDIDATIPRY